MQSFLNTTAGSSIFSTSSTCLASSRGRFLYTIKRVNTIVEAFDTINNNPKNLWVDRGGSSYNGTMHRWLKENDIDGSSTYNEGNAVVVERFNRILKTRMWMCTSQSTTPIDISTFGYPVEAMQYLPSQIYTNDAHQSQKKRIPRLELSVWKRSIRKTL